MRVLIAEDELRLAAAIARGLRRRGIAVDLAPDGKQALAKARVVRYDVLVLDRELPGVHGDEVCRLIRGERPETGILMLTAAGALEDVIEGLVPAWVDADPGLLERLIANLLDNGIHHNVPGGFLSVKTEVRDRRLRLIVSNGGPRIESDELTELAEPFRRVKRSGSGFGLGLSIVRSVAEAHGGTLTLSAPASGGLVVVVELPRPRPAQVPRRGRTEALPA